MRKFTIDSEDDLYSDLMRLCEDEESGFYFVDHGDYRVFTYRLVSWSTFDLPNALNCRGTTFKMVEGYWRLVSLPMHKFFNLHEGGRFDELVGDEFISYQDKLDGSLISTCFTHDDDFFTLKSKTSFESEMAVDALAYLKGNRELYDDVMTIIHDSRGTVNFEWTSPKNRIVVPYASPALTILNVRLRDGTYIPRKRLMMYIGDHESIVAENAFNGVSGEVQDFINTTYKSTDQIEGYVLHLADGDMVKIKTEQYCRLHKLKDSVNNDGALFEAIVHENADDLLEAFHDDEMICKRIVEMQEWMIPRFNRLHANVVRFVDENKDLCRKDFAIKGQAELTKLEFTLAMDKYIGRNNEELFGALLIKASNQFITEFNEENNGRT